MARRKRVLDDSDSDSSDNSDLGDYQDEDLDSREERALFEDPYKHKRRKRNGKNDALYGIFAESDGEEPTASTSSGRKKNDWAKAPAFVTGETVDLEKDLDVDMDRLDTSDEAENEEQEDHYSSDYSEPEEAPVRSPSPVQSGELEDMMTSRPRIGGIGFSSSSKISASSFTKAGKDDGSSSSQANVSSQVEDDSVLSSFGRTTAFARASSSFAQPKPAANLTTSERAHFSSISGSFGARMLSNMGWTSGTGLGATGGGIVTPIESKLRPQKMGLAYRGFGEKTDQSKSEARRRGEVVSDNESDGGKRKSQAKAKQQSKGQRSDAWKKPKKTKLKIEHKTYEEIIGEAGVQQASGPGLGVIIDATGATPREVSSIADVSLDPWTPSNDLTRIPEVRHNLRLLADMCKRDLDGLAKEAKELETRKKWITDEDTRLRKAVSEETELIDRLQKVHLIVDSIQTKSNELSTSYECTIEPLSPLFYQLLHDFQREFDKYKLDEIVVAAIAPIIRRMVNSWDPLADPSYFSSIFRTWKQALKVDVVQESESTHLEVYGNRTGSTSLQSRESFMTPVESLLWNVVLPKIRSALNNEWSPDNPQPAVKLFESWSTFMPTFIRDNVMDQLILPKVYKAVVDWSQCNSSVSLHTIVFPWLPLVGLRLDDFLADPRRKIKSMLRSWTVEDEIPADLAAWRSVFDIKEWDALMLKYVIPKLGATLRTDFRVNPRDQKMDLLLRVLAWRPLLRASFISQLLETGFFPKWLEVLHLWLIQPSANLEEVTQWYLFWKGTFSEDVKSLPGVSRGFTTGLQLMNTALELGPAGRSKLPRPDFTSILQSKPSDVPAAPATTRSTAARQHEITFKSIVEEFAASHNLLFLPTGRAHEKSRMPLYRISPSVEGKGGLTVYILDDAVWASNTTDSADPMDYRAITLEDMVQRANINSR